MEEQIKVGDFIEVTTPGGGKFPAIAAYSWRFDPFPSELNYETIQPLNYLPFNAVYPLTSYVAQIGIVSPHVYYDAKYCQTSKQVNYYQGMKEEESALKTEDGHPLREGDSVWALLRDGTCPPVSITLREPHKGCMYFKELEKAMTRRNLIKKVFSIEEVEEICSSWYRCTKKEFIDILLMKLSK